MQCAFGDAAASVSAERIAAAADARRSNMLTGGRNIFSTSQEAKIKMLTNKAKSFESDIASYSQDFPSSERKTVTLENKLNNVLPLERPKHNTGKLKLSESRRPGEGKAEAAETEA